MKQIFILILISSLTFVGGFIVRPILIKSNTSIPAEVAQQPVANKPLEKYTIKNLSTADIKISPIEIGRQLTESENYYSYIFKHNHYPAISDQQLKVVTGKINVPKGNDTYPAIVMIRGYVDQTSYETGVGTKNAAAFFAENGFITIAPDYLGYGGSDRESGNVFENRFQTYTTTLSIIHSVQTLANWDKKNILIWGHSNGGQISLTTLTITKEDYPTVLWAPVSKPFPYSILYFSDEPEDKGKFIRHELAEFELLYDVEQFSFDNYLEGINAPIQVHQGTADDAVPVSWSDNLVYQLKNKDKNVEYFTYPGTDHNLRPNWNVVAERSLKFYRDHLK